MTQATIAFIGGGNMATSLVGGLIADGWPRERLVVADPDRDARACLEQRFSLRTTADNRAAAEEAEVVVLAVKPQAIHDAARAIAATVKERQTLVISIAAGVPLSALAARLGTNTAIVRVMPNTPALIGQGASVLSANERVSDKQRELAQTLLGAAGITLWVEDEEFMHAVTALSGSGPAYFFYLLEALIAAGIEAGLPEDLARQLALKTGQGACAMALDSDDAPAELRRKVTSPGGTTERALEILKQGNFAKLITEAVLGATERSRELNKKLKT